MKRLLATAALALATLVPAAGAAPASGASDATEVVVVQNGGMYSFTGPITVTHEKAIGTKQVFTLTEGQSRSVYAARGDKFTTEIRRVASNFKKKS